MSQQLDVCRFDSKLCVDSAKCLQAVQDAASPDPQPDEPGAGKDEPGAGKRKLPKVGRAVF